MTKLLITSSNTWCTYHVDDLYTHSSTGDKMVSRCNHVKCPLLYLLSTKEKSDSAFVLYLQLFQSKMYSVMHYRRRLFGWACEENYMAWSVQFLMRTGWLLPGTRVTMLGVGSWNSHAHIKAHRITSDSVRCKHIIDCDVNATWLKLWEWIKTRFLKVYVDIYSKVDM